MTDTTSEGPSLIKLGKLANSKDFDKLEGLWLEALNQRVTPGKNSCPSRVRWDGRARLIVPKP